jgi:hypothetical protein
LAGDGFRSGVIAAAVSNGTLPDGSQKVVLPDHKLTIIPCEAEVEADYLASFLNSDVTQLIVRSYALATGISTHILDRVATPRFSRKAARHCDLAELDRRARLGLIDETGLSQISVLSAQVIGLSMEQAEIVRKELARL